MNIIKGSHLRYLTRASFIHLWHGEHRDELQISLMEKEGEREGVVSVASYIPSTMWGFPGTGGSERELKVVMPSTTGRKANRPDMGTVVLRLQYQAEVSPSQFGLACSDGSLCDLTFNLLEFSRGREVFGLLYNYVDWF